MYRHLLVATDGSELAAKAVHAGIALAAQLSARLTLVLVTEPWQQTLPVDPGAMLISAQVQADQRQRQARDIAEVLDSAVRQAQEAGVHADRVHVEGRVAADGILDTASSCGADLIVMASHGRRGLGQLLLGSQTRSVLSLGRLPVLVVR